MPTPEQICRLGGLATGEGWIYDEAAIQECIRRLTIDQAATPATPAPSSSPFFVCYPRRCGCGCS